ncbi:MAG TPA: class III extradiol ring-cleavage dioxygenase [Stellaceae bacterium]|nr:class III extradiol ring-cleavage dioxygenase [Stellaceae bacterium]
MTDPVLDSYFVSHGAPTLALDPGATGEFWQRLGAELPRPRAVLAVSAHWATAAPEVSAAAKPDTIHDFYGFPEPLYRIFYPAPGAPALGERVAALLGAAGLACTIDRDRGLDHGAWVPLRSMFPAADVPVVQLAVQPQLDALWHQRLGAALAPLRSEGVLILASGGAVHNLREVAWHGGETPEWAREFDEWLAAALAAGREGDLVGWQRKAPQARRAHPTPEHFLPLFVALGAAGPGARGTRLFQGFTLGSMSMAAFRFAA